MKKKIVDSAATKEIDSIVQMFGELFGEIHDAFMKHRLSLRYQQASGDLSRQLRQSLAKFYSTAGDLSGYEALAVQATAINFSKVFYDILRLSSMVETKVKEKIIFTDEAVKEMTDIMTRTKNLLPNVGDAVQTANPLIAKHVEKEANDLNNVAFKSAALHQERLCKGVCHPKASAVFMQMLLQLQDIVWHCQALASEHDGIPSA